MITDELEELCKQGCVQPPEQLILNLVEECTYL